jgi:hypothetical protein
MRGLEILELDTSRGDYVRARVALDHHLVIPFEIPKSTYVEDFPRPEDFEAFLARQARTLLDHFGDARECRPLPSEGS